MPEREEREEREEMAKLTVDLARRTLKALRLKALQEDKSVREVITQLVERYLARKGD